jgi:hypothetical protein
VRCAFTSPVDSNKQQHSFIHLTILPSFYQKYYLLKGAVCC